MHGRGVLMSSRRLHSCLSYTVYFRETLVSEEMYSVRGETVPYGLSQNVLQILLGASVGVLLKATIGHQEALVVSKEGWALRAVSDKQQSYLMAKFRTGQTTGRKLDVEMVAREILQKKPLTSAEFCHKIRVLLVTDCPESPNLFLKQ